MGKKHKRRFASGSTIGQHSESVKGNAQHLEGLVHEIANTSPHTTSIAKQADRDTKQAANNPVAAHLLAKMQERDDYLRSICVCVECGGKALYYIHGKRYCKQHIEEAMTAEKKRITPRDK